MSALVVARARAFVGRPFRVQGRDETGLDCIGLVAAALGTMEVPNGYRLRSGDLERLEGGLAHAGLMRCALPGAGCVLAMRAGPGQLHLGIWTGESLIHADAQLRRVVERPGAPPWPVLSVWRAEGEG